MNELYLSHYVFHLLAFLRARAYGRDGAINVGNLARTIRLYPGFDRNFYDSFNRADIPSGIGVVDFLYLVDARLKESGA